MLKLKIKNMYLLITNEHNDHKYKPGVNVNLNIKSKIDQCGLNSSNSDQPMIINFNKNTNVLMGILSTHYSAKSIMIIFSSCQCIGSDGYFLRNLMLKC